MNKVHVVFIKHFTKGNLKGLTITDYLSFTSHKAEQDWVAGCDRNIAGGKLPWKFAEVNGRRAIVVCEGSWSEQFVRDFETWFKHEGGLE